MYTVISSVLYRTMRYRLRTSAYSEWPPAAPTQTVASAGTAMTSAGVMWLCWSSTPTAPCSFQPHATTASASESGGHLSNGERGLLLQRMRGMTKVASIQACEPSSLPRIATTCSDPHAACNSCIHRDSAVKPSGPYTELRRGMSGMQAPPGQIRRARCRRHRRDRGPADHSRYGPT